MGVAALRMDEAGWQNSDTAGLRTMYLYLRRKQKHPVWFTQNEQQLPSHPLLRCESRVACKRRSRLLTSIVRGFAELGHSNGACRPQKRQEH